MTKAIITSGKTLCNIFSHYIENTNNVIIYKLGSHHLPSNIQFPKADTTTLINCTKEGIFNILTPNTFPNLKQVNYLSTHPGNYNIGQRFSNVKWEFPDKDYDFYDYMINRGYGKKNIHLLSSYLKNKRMIDGQNGHDISFYFDILISDFYASDKHSIIEGEWLRNQFYEYCVKKQQEYYDQEDDELR
jgi:hypothetical protein